jgi:hypothetical protein
MRGFPSPGNYWIESRLRLWLARLPSDKKAKQTSCRGRAIALSGPKSHVARQRVQPMPEDCRKKHAAVCDTQLITAEGLKTLIGKSGSLIPEIARFALGGHVVRQHRIP